MKFHTIHTFPKLLVIICCLVGLAFGSRPASAQTTILTVDRDDDTVAACFRQNGTTCHCTSDPNDCTLRQAVQTADELGVPVEIRFADTYRIRLMLRPITVVADDLLINGQYPGDLVVEGNGLARGFIVKGDNVGFNQFRMEDFSAEYIKIDPEASHAELSNMVLVGEGCGSTPPNNSASGIVVEGTVATGMSKAWIWRSSIGCMGDEGLLLDSTSDVFIGTVPGTPAVHNPINKNYFTSNKIGIRVTNSCEISEEYSNITNNAEEGIHVGLANGCTDTEFEPGVVTGNGSHGVQVVQEGSNFTRLKVRPTEIHSNGDTPIALEHGSVPYRPFISNYFANTNEVAVSVNNTADRIYVYELSADPDEAGGGGTFLSQSNLASTQITYLLDLDNFPGLTPSDVGFILLNGENIVSGIPGYTSLISPQYVPTAATAVALSQQTGVSTVYPLVLLLTLLLGVSGGLIWRRPR